MSATLELTGIKDLDRKLQQMASENGVGSVKKHMRKATRKAVKTVMLPAAQRNAPVLTGTLRKAMTVRAAKGKRGSVGHMVSIKGGPFEGGFFYPAVQEFGSDKMNIHPPTEKFLRRATYDNQSQVVDIFIGALRASIREAAR